MRDILKKRLNIGARRRGLLTTTIFIINSHAFRIGVRSERICEIRGMWYAPADSILRGKRYYDLTVPNVVAKKYTAVGLKLCLISTALTRYSLCNINLQHTDL